MRNDCKASIVNSKWTGNFSLRYPYKTFVCFTLFPFAKCEVDKLIHWFDVNSSQMTLSAFENPLRRNYLLWACIICITLPCRIRPTKACFCTENLLLAKIQQFILLFYPSIQGQGKYLLCVVCCSSHVSASIRMLYSIWRHHAWCMGPLMSFVFNSATRHNQLLCCFEQF